MPRENIEHDGKWAVWSTIVDDFITDFMDVPEFSKWRKAEYGEDDTIDCIAGKTYFNRRTLHEALMCLGTNQGVEAVREFVARNELRVDYEWYKNEILRCLNELEEKGGCVYNDPPMVMTVQISL